MERRGKGREGEGREGRKKGEEEEGREEEGREEEGREEGIEEGKGDNVHTTSLLRTRVMHLGETHP